MNSISVISIPVTDQQRAKEFYLQLGFQLIIEAPMGPSQSWIQLGLPGTETSITLVNWFKEMPAGSLRGFIVDCDDIDSEIKTLTDKEIKVEPIDETPWGRYAAVIDPDGNHISIHCK